jgi:hypothetical protein
VFSKEFGIQHPRRGAPNGLIVQRKQRLANSGDGGDIAPDLDLVILRADACLGAS